MSDNLEMKFETETDFRKALYEITLPNNAEKIIEHEREHYEEARARGYSPYYQLRINKDRFTCSTALKEIKVNIHDRIAILLAPKNPSETDYMLAEAFKIDALQK